MSTDSSPRRLENWLFLLLKIKEKWGRRDSSVIAQCLKALAVLPEDLGSVLILTWFTTLPITLGT